MEITTSRIMDLDCLPPGYRFRPLDSELIVDYLEKKLKNEPLPPNKIMEVNLYSYNPEQLEEMYYQNRREIEMFFFTERDRKYPNGSRPNRTTPSGYWKATGADKSIMFEGEQVGFMKTLVFHRQFPKDLKTNWIMHEFGVHNQQPSNKHAKLDWVLCRIYERVSRSSTEHLDSDNNEVTRLESEDNMDVFEVPSSTGTPNANELQIPYASTAVAHELQIPYASTPVAHEHQIPYGEYGTILEWLPRSLQSSINPINPFTSRYMRNENIRGSMSTAFSIIPFKSS